MEGFAKKDLIITICGTIFLTTIIGLIAFALTQNSGLKIINLSEFGSYFGGVLGPILSFITIMILLRDKEDNEKRNNLTTALKMYEYTKIILKNKESELKYQGTTLQGQQRIYTGFELLDYFQNGLDLNMYNQDTEYIFNWIEEYVHKLKELYDLLLINDNLRKLLMYDFSKQCETLISFSLSFKEFENGGLFENDPNIRQALKQTRKDLMVMFPENLLLKD